MRRGIETRRAADSGAELAGIPWNSGEGRTCSETGLEVSHLTNVFRYINELPASKRRFSMYEEGHTEFYEDTGDNMHSRGTVGLVVDDRAIGTMADRIAATIAVGGILLLLLSGTRRDNPLARHVVGDLADVLEELGEQLRDANTREREQSSIHFGSAEIELSLTAESGTEGHLSFKVVDGVSRRNSSRVSTVKVTVYPTSDFEIGQ